MTSLFNEMKLNFDTHLRYKLVLCNMKLFFQVKVAYKKESGLDYFWNILD